MTRQLIIGGSGQIGKHLKEALKAVGQNSIGTFCGNPFPGLQRLDIRDQKAIADIFESYRPEITYLAAAASNVDQCELHPRQTYEVNVLGTLAIVQAVNEAGGKLVFFSSDYVFPGNEGPYREGDPPNPICEYGRQKLIGEHLVALHAKDFIIVRTTVVFGWESQGKNFVQRFVDALDAGNRIRVPTDQIGSPTYAPNLATAVVELASQDATGLFHICGPKLASRYEFSKAVAKMFDLDVDLIEPVPTALLNQVAARPLSAGMRVDKAQKVLQTRLVDYSEGLELMLRADPEQEAHGA